MEQMDENVAPEPTGSEENPAMDTKEGSSKDATETNENNVGDVNNNEGTDKDIAENGQAEKDGHDETAGQNTGNENVNADDNAPSNNMTPRVGIVEKEPEEIDQFDSVSNAVSQHEPPAKQTPKPREVVQVPVPNVSTTPRAKKVKKGVFVSYSPDAGFMERKFVVETIRQLKENNLAEDIWFDKDEDNTDSPCWFSLRMEAVEKCRAAIMVLSDSYFLCPVSVYEGKTLIERTKTSPHSVAIFPIMFSAVDKSEPHKDFYPVMNQAVDLTTPERSKLSLAEKTSVVIGTIMESLEKYACMNLPLQIVSPQTEFTGNYKKKKICQWNVWDLQEWLLKMGIKEFYRQSLAENMVDGFLLMSLTDQDMISMLGIDSRVVRKKIMQNILTTLDKEHKNVDNWHLRARAQRAKPDMVYMIYDPADVRLAQNIKLDLKKKNLQVHIHLEIYLDMF